MKTGTWLTAKRLHAHGILLAIALWSIYLWTIATPGLRDRNGNLKGTDFLHFYTLGTLAIDHRGADLYDMNEQADVAAKRVPQAAGIRYLPLYPPQLSLVFGPLAHFSYRTALVLWWVFDSLMWAASCLAVWSVCPGLRPYGWTVAMLAVASPAFFNLIAWGQTSAIALVCFTLMFFFLRSRREFLAGLVFGCLIFKPQLAIAATILFLAIGAWRVLLGAAISATVQLTAGVLYYGVQPLQTWVHILWNVEPVANMLEPRPYQTHCLRTFWSMLLPWASLSLLLYVISAVVILSGMISVWRRSPDETPRYSLMLLATVLVSPHLTVYDLVVLAPAFLLLADWLIGQGHSSFTIFAGSALYLAYMLPLVSPFTRWTHVQLSVLTMSFLMYVVWKRAYEESSSRPSSPSATQAV